MRRLDDQASGSEKNQKNCDLRQEEKPTSYGRAQKRRQVDCRHPGIQVQVWRLSGLGRVLYRCLDAVQHD